MNFGANMQNTCNSDEFICSLFILAFQTGVMISSRFGVWLLRAQAPCYNPPFLNKSPSLEQARPLCPGPPPTSLPGHTGWRHLPAVLTSCGNKGPRLLSIPPICQCRNLIKRGDEVAWHFLPGCSPAFCSDNPLPTIWSWP